MANFHKNVKINKSQMAYFDKKICLMFKKSCDSGCRTELMMPSRHIPSWQAEYYSIAEHTLKSIMAICNRSIHSLEHIPTPKNFFLIHAKADHRMGITRKLKVEWIHSYIHPNSIQCRYQTMLLN